jgi:hypothetical protein
MRGTLPLSRSTATNSSASFHHHVVTPVFTDLATGVLARNGNGGDIFALANGLRCSAIRNFHNFNNFQDRIPNFVRDNLSQFMRATG